MNNMKFMAGLIAYGMTLCVVLAVAGAFWGMHEYNKPGPAQEATLFEIERGSGLSAIAAALRTQNLIDNEFVFKAGTVLQNKQTGLKAGEYEIAPGMSAAQITALLHDGKTVARRFTVPEGLTSYEIVQRLNGIEALSGNVAAIPAEGSLLPDTYDYRLNESREDILVRMEKAMSALAESPPAGLCAKEQEQPCWPEPLTSWDEVIILASIVEKETGVAEERKRIAGVFFNRLRKGIPLQTDPTVIYAITKGKHKNDGKGPLGRRLLRKDLEFDSPYNTYKYAGLPPGPIANPGRASIEAVLDPEDNDFIYFVADGTGGHVFAKTLAEHNRNVAEWRKIRRMQ